MSHDQREAECQAAVGRSAAFIKGTIREVVPLEHQEAFADDFFSVFENADFFSYRYNRYARALPLGVAAVPWPKFVHWWAQIRIQEWEEFADRCNALNPQPVIKTKEKP